MATNRILTRGNEKEKDNSHFLFIISDHLLSPNVNKKESASQSRESLLFFLNILDFNILNVLKVKFLI